MIILEDYTALSNLSNNRKVYKIKHESGTCCYKTKAVQETKLLISLGYNKHLPRLIDYNLEEGWLIKEWCSGKTLDHYMYWNVHMVRQFYDFTKSLFNYLHSHNLVLQDFKPWNISYDNKFMYFDLDWVVKEKTQFANLLGSKKYLYKSFESLYSLPLASINDDYFSFSNVVYNSLVGPPKWSNSKKDPMEAYEQYENEYKEFKDEFLDSLNSIGLKPYEVNFIIDCFNPIRQNRPQVFNWDNYSSCS
jgi:hypothetical protein